MLTIKSSVSVSSDLEVGLVSGSGHGAGWGGSTTGGMRGGSRTSVVHMTSIHTKYLVSIFPVINIQIS